MIAPASDVVWNRSYEEFLNVEGDVDESRQIFEDNLTAAFGSPPILRTLPLIPQSWWSCSEFPVGGDARVKTASPGESSSNVLVCG